MQRVWGSCWATQLQTVTGQLRLSRGEGLAGAGIGLGFTTWAVVGILSVRRRRRRAQLPCVGRREREVGGGRAWRSQVPKGRKSSDRRAALCCAGQQREEQQGLGGGEGSRLPANRVLLALTERFWREIEMRAGGPATSQHVELPDTCLGAVVNWMDGGMDG